MITIADMTISELMAAPTTDELMREISKRVWEAQGNCAHRNYGKHTMCCEQCNKHLGANVGHIPDITRPEVFWPVCEEHGIIVCPYPDSNNEYRAGILIGYYEGLYAFCMHGMALAKNPGLAVAFAFLKTKEDESKMNSLDLPDAEDVLEMRGKSENEDG